MGNQVTQFKKGQTPWNKGIEYLAIKGEKHPMFGKKHKPESIEKMSQSRKGSIPWNKGKKGMQVAWNKGLPSPWAKNSKTLFKKGHKLGKRFEKGSVPWDKGLKGVVGGWNKGKHNEKISGDKHYAWKGGITSENKKIRHSLEIKIWRDSVFQRDEYICQMPGCDQKERYLNAHHIKRFKDFNEIRFEVSNGITLCKNCHNLTKHKEEKYENLFIEIIKSKQK